MANLERAYPPSKYIKDYLEQKEWTQADLAMVLGWIPSDVSNLLLRKKKLTPEIAKQLAAIFNKDSNFWMDVESKYILAQSDDIDEKSLRRLELFKKFPAVEMLKRGWIDKTDDINELEQRFNDFFDDAPLAFAARKTGSYSEVTMEQVAWVRRAYKLASGVMAKAYSKRALAGAMEKLKMLLYEPEEIRHIPKILAEAGVKLLIIEQLPNTKIDGVTFWVNNTPVIVLSLRFDRIDSFWHTLLHELSHVENDEGKDSPIIDVNIAGEDSDRLNREPFEVRADKDAAEFSISKQKLDSFIMRVHPTYSEMKIQGFAALNKVHPGILVGQLHHRFAETGKGLPYSHHRKFLVKIRQIVTQSALTDGFGYRPLI